MDWTQDDPTLRDIQFDPRATAYDPLNPPFTGADPLGTQHFWHVPEPAIEPDAWDPDEELAQMLYTTSSVTPAAPAPPHSHAQPRRPVNRRRPRPGFHAIAAKHRIITVVFLVVMIIVSAVMMLGWSVSYSYNQLRGISLLVVSAKLARWWPLMVYGPWLVAGLSILRASVQHRSARRSWSVMLIASATAVALCVGQSPRSLLAMVVVGIPPITALICFRELVGQISPHHGPRHACQTLRRPKQPRR
ncbi:DUF2637 domain-containing protein [Streptomyces sp. NPDC007095]|jgi:hypothetical protein|uniref:DUF2637 domain-containing protein n=1 Tax=Streptomyces sp. NPDC007095 TaxID=3154482 RepID=UPI000C71323A